MQTVALYKYERENGGLTVSPIKPDNITYTIGYRLLADEDKAITNGTTITTCADVDSAEGWSDCELPEETDIEN